MTKKKTKRENPYVSLPNHVGIKKHKNTGRYQASKSIDGQGFNHTFDTLMEARRWRRTFNGQRVPENNGPLYSSLKDVWQAMQKGHFPTLAKSTIEIWHRRYELWKPIEHLPMNKITSSKIRTWIEENVEFFKSDFYEGNCRGRAKRCNLDNELKLFVTIFNWYKGSELFEVESKDLTNPVRREHKRLGFIRAKVVKEVAITLDDAIKFFNALKPLYRDLAMFQYFTASRIGEVAGLQWNRIEFDRNKVTIMETCRWDMTTKQFIELNPHPKNKEPRPMHITSQLEEILRRRLEHREEGSDFVFHVEGKPLNYGTIQVNYKRGQKLAGLPYSGTHILRHGMAKLARMVGGGLDAVIAMTGHKDIKLADHYSKLDSEYQKEISLKLSDEIRKRMEPDAPKVDEVPNLSELTDNVVSFAEFRERKAVL